MRRYDHGPSRIEPSRPIVRLSAGRTIATDVEPVMPKTTKATAASVGDSFHEGRTCVVHDQNFSANPPLVELDPESVESWRRARLRADDERSARHMFAAVPTRRCRAVTCRSRARGCDVSRGERR